MGKTVASVTGKITVSLKGEQGNDGNGIASAVVLYAVYDYDSSAPADTATWAEEVGDLTLADNKYVWTCTKTTYTDGSVVYQGKRCLGSTRAFVEKETLYGLSESGTVAPLNWSTSYKPTEGYYLWQCTRYYWSELSTYGDVTCVGYFAKNGTNGVAGMVMRVTEWTEGAEYHNDESLTTTPRYLDIVTVTDSTTGDFKIYQCVVSNTASSANKPGVVPGYWKAMNDMSPIYTPLIVAKNAVMRLAQSNQIVIVNSNSKVQGCFGGVDDETNGYPLWIGGETADGANFRVKYDGTMEATGGAFSGDIELKGLTYATYITNNQDVNLEELASGVVKEIAYMCPQITRSYTPAYLTAASSNVKIIAANATSPSSSVSSLEITGIGKLVGTNVGGITYWIQCPYTLSWT